MSDGRLGERENLMRAVGAAGPFSDDDLMRAAIRLWGQATPYKLDGEFALAAWHPGREELFLCRDAIGGHPLYYHRMAGGLVFASDLPLLLRLPFVPRRLNEAMIASTLANDPRRPASATFYNAIDLLPAGHALYYANDELVVRRWWQPPAVEIRHAEPSKKLRDEITAAVEDRMRDGQSVAVLLSGGLDSSAIACIAARRLKREGRRLLAFSSVLPSAWDGPETDERAHIEAVLEQEDNIDIHWLDVPPQCGPFSATEQSFELLGQPGYSNVSHIEHRFASLGRAHGVDVVLSGFGGDFFASWRGQGVVAALMRAGQWRRAASELIALHRRMPGTWPHLLKREILAPLASRLATRARPRREPDFTSLAFADPRAQMRFVCEPGRMELMLNASVPFFARGFGLSLRLPLLDRRIVEFMLSVPVDELQRDGETRGLFRRAMQGVLPDKIRLRQDKGPAFDPLLAARIAAARADLQAWSVHTKDAACWRHVDRASFLSELAAVRPAAREAWRPGMFQHVLIAGTLARFVEWHTQRERWAA